MYRIVLNRMTARSLVPVLALLLLMLAPAAATLAAPAEQAAKKPNEITGIELVEEGPPVVHIRTTEPVGYRYTVYDSFDPVRVVVDFPGMDVSAAPPLVEGSGFPVEEIRVSSFDLTSGRLGRVELLLSKTANYEVKLEENDFRIEFSGAGGEAAGTASAEPAGAISAVAPAETPASAAVEKAAPAQDEPAATALAPAESAAKPAARTEAPPQKPAGSVISDLEVRDYGVTLFTEGPVERYQYFELGGPPRLVLDVYGVQPAFKERQVPAGRGFEQIRVGLYDAKTRLVFDASGESVPEHTVAQEGDRIDVTWGSGQGATRPVSSSVSVTTAADGPKPATGLRSTETVVEGLDFRVEDGESILSVVVSGPVDLIQPAARGQVIGFGVRDAGIDRSLKRVLDTSSFPTPILRVTPYTVLVGDSQDVRFAVEMKELTEYRLERDGDVLRLVIDNDGFTAEAPVEDEVVALPAPAAQKVPRAAAAPAAAEAPEVQAEAPAPEAGTTVGDSPVRALTEESPKSYTGQKISLVFDNADIRNILQLIAEVSDLNIIASDDVKGNITLRLIDVPWDQALDLIMDIKGLGMIKQGNVARILPREQIRAMDEAKLAAARTKEKLEDLVTEVVSVSYTDLGNVAGPSRELLTDRGKITEDNRNKQLIITDIPSVIEKIKNLVAVLDTPERQVMIEARIVEASSTFSRDLGVKWGFHSEAENRDVQLENHQFDLGLGGSFLISPPAAGSVLGGAGLGAGFTFGKIGSTSLDLRISALEAAGEGRVISTPRVSTLNGGEAKISQGTKIPYQSSGPDGPKTEFVDANLELTVTPVINPDNSVILDISATNSSIGTTVSTGTGGNAPAIDTKEAKTKLLVRDGETTVIGGIFVETDNSSEAGVPWLRKLPFVGQLFKSTNNSKTRSELLIFITPRIVN